MKRTVSIFLCLAIILLTFSSCGGKGTDAGIVTPIDNDPKYLDPQIATDIGAKNIISNCFEGLVRLGNNGEIIPAAAESYNISDNGLVYTFKINQNGRWLVTNSAKRTINSKSPTAETTTGEGSTGEGSAVSTTTAADVFDRSVTANDFAFALKRALSPETICPIADRLMNIKNAKAVLNGKKTVNELGVSVRDRYTLVIELERKDDDFIYTLTDTACMPCNEEFFNLTDGRYGLSSSTLIFNGPFYISNWSETTAISLRRSEDVYMSGNKAEAAKPKSIYYSINSEQSTRGKKIDNGNYDLAPLTQEQAQEFEGNKKITVNRFSNIVTSIVFNCSDEKMKNSSLRAAMAYAVDLSGIRKSFGREAAVGIVPSACMLSGKLYRESAAAFKSNTTDTEKAKKLFGQALKQLEISDIELKFLCTTDNESVVRETMQQWQSIFGVSFGISVEAVDKAKFMEKIEKDDYQIALYDIEYTDPSAKAAVSRFKSGAEGNVVNYSDKRYDAVIDKLSQTTGGKDTVKAIEEAESYLISSCAIIPVCEKETIVACAKGVSDVVLNNVGKVAYYKNTLRK